MKVTCSLCFLNAETSEEREKQAAGYCRILGVNSICDQCLDRIEQSKKEYIDKKKEVIQDDTSREASKEASG